MRLRKKKCFLTDTDHLSSLLSLVVVNNPGEKSNQEKVWSFQLQEKQRHRYRKHSRSPGEEVRKTPLHYFFIYFVCIHTPFYTFYLCYHPKAYNHKLIFIIKPVTCFGCMQSDYVWEQIESVSLNKL